MLMGECSLTKQIQAVTSLHFSTSFHFLTRFTDGNTCIPSSNFHDSPSGETVNLSECDLRC